MSREWLGFHCDTTDVVGLMVLRTAKSGGRSMFASSVAISETIASTSPELYEILQQPFYWSWKGCEAAGAVPYYQQPIFTRHEGRFASRYIKTHILSAQEFPDVPRLTEEQQAAMTAIDRLAMDPEYHYSMEFEPGDIQFLNNHVTYHSRTAFEDYDETDRKRHLLRLWLATPNSRALSSSMSAIYRDQSPGAVRGGFPSKSGKRVFETKVAES
jgi:alpha-ketoglutarate-dependent taurine dioxygenase